VIEQSFHLTAIGVAGSGIADWAALQNLLEHPESGMPVSGSAPVTTMLSASERRRVSDMTRMVLAAVEQACPSPAEDMQAVFVSQTGDGVTTHAICDALAAAEPSVSPTRFTNSVHNAAAAYWSIALRRTAATTSLCAGPNGLSAGLLESILTMHATGAPVLLIAYDAPYPFPLSERVPVLHALALALFLTPGSGRGSWRLALNPGEAPYQTPAFAGHFGAHACVPGLIWLSAKDTQRRVVLPYLDGISLVLEPSYA
jgi:hypothetical protein